MSKFAANGPQELAFLIPDISGFTKFLSTTEIKHSRHIIEELIEIIARETKTHFELAEVEGDALFLYQDANAISPSDVFEVAKRTFTAFHQHLLNYERLRICTCGACTTAINLSLKFITHVGQIEFAKVHGKYKPYGLEVIKAHRLLKNNVEGKEYFLMSTDFSKRYSNTNIGVELTAGAASYDEIGEIRYQYTQLSHLKDDLVADESKLAVPGQSLETLATATEEIDAPVGIVYEVLSDFQYRPVWNSESKIVDHTEEDIYQVGTEHFCIVNNKKFQVKTVGNPDSRLEFGEQILNSGPFKELNLYFIFNKSEDTNQKTSLSIEIRASIRTLLKPLVYLLAKPKLKKKIPEVIASIKQLSEKIALARLEGEKTAFSA